MKFMKTLMMKRYLIKFSIRIIVFLSIFSLYLIDKDYLWYLVTKPIHLGITPMHIVWLGFMLMMFYHIFPKEPFTMALLKSEKDKYHEVKDYDEIGLFHFVKYQNQRAWIVMLVWLLFNAIFGLLFAFQFIDEPDLYMLTVFYFLCDYICILIYCPFQSHIMKNKCCVNCRIYDWGHFMMFTPMVFIRNFYTWSLFFMSCIVLIRWELIYAKFPERFWSGSNKNLQCAHCKDKTCQIKNNLKVAALKASKKRM